jgi:hypothetical protein
MQAEIEQFEKPMAEKAVEAQEIQSGPGRRGVGAAE